MYPVDLEKINELARAFSGLDDARAAHMAEIAQRIEPFLDDVTDEFYRRLQEIEPADLFLQGRVDSLKKTHRDWLGKVFSGAYDSDYVSEMYAVGETHVNVRLPLEFMAGAMTLLMETLTPALAQVSNDREELANTVQSVNAVLGFSLMIMQESYHATSLANELSRFLKVTGISRELFSNLADTEKP
jgi:truncated hemoglobin YjbI